PPVFLQPANLAAPPAVEGHRPESGPIRGPHPGHGEAALRVYPFHLGLPLPGIFPVDPDKLRDREALAGVGPQDHSVLGKMISHGLILGGHVPPQGPDRLLSGHIVPPKRNEVSALRVFAKKFFLVLFLSRKRTVYAPSNKLSCSPSQGGREARSTATRFRNTPSCPRGRPSSIFRSEEHTSELQSR